MEGRKGKEEGGERLREGIEGRERGRGRSEGRKRRRGREEVEERDRKVGGEEKVIRGKE